MVEGANARFKEQGTVAFGKFGSRLSDRVLSETADAVAEGRLRLFVVIKENDVFQGFSAEVIELGSTSKRIAEFFPAYYQALDDWPTSYALLKSELKPCELGELRLASNDRPLLTVLSECRTASLLVYAASEEGAYIRL